VNVDFGVAGTSVRISIMRSNGLTPCRLKTSPSHMGSGTFHDVPSAFRMRDV
jgi:hypothetical protein